MAQHDYNIANGGGAAVRADINNALTAIQSLNSGSTAPTATVAGMFWYDTATGTLKQRNAGNTAWVSAAELIGGGGQLAGMRNKIINGKMDIAQRGTSFAAIASGAYSLDRWLIAYTSTAVATVTQNSDVPSNNEFQYSYRCTVTPTADTSIAAGDYAAIGQYIEGFNVRDLIGKTFTLSFWVRSAKTGVHCVSFRNSSADRSYVVEYTVNAANTWEQKSITVSGGLITAGTWDWTNGIGLRLWWALACGTTFQTTAGAWQTGNFIATSNQVNVLDTIGNIFAITGVQLEVGGVATQFEHRPVGVELAMCQRYYCKSYTTADGTAPGTSGALSTSTNGNASALDQTFSVRFPVQMRSAPTVIAVNPTQTWGNANWRSSSDTVDFTTLVEFVNANGARVRCQNVSGSTWGYGHFYASIEL